MPPAVLRSTPGRRRLRPLGIAATAAAGLAGGGFAYAMRRVNSIGVFPPEALRDLRRDVGNPLFDAYPALGDRIPWRSIGSYPTPVVEYDLPSARPGTRLFVKRDDLSSELYGGNKVRKLEYLLAEAELSGRGSLITLGAVGSNHALATAIHGGALGFAVDLALYDQPITACVRKNFGGFLAAGARLHYGRSVPGSFLLASRLYAQRHAVGHAPYFVMVGGSSRLGCIGHVSAAFELARQVADGLIPEPDVLFIPLGTVGTAAGLLVGLRLAGLRTRLMAVRVADPFPANAFVLRYAAQDVADFLHSADAAIPRLIITDRDFEVLPNYFGPGYGVPTMECESAVRFAEPELSLETTYTGKTLAACLDLCRSESSEAVVLFWNTYSSAPIPAPDTLDWEGVPSPLRHLVVDAFPSR